VTKVTRNLQVGEISIRDGFSPPKCPETQLAPEHCCIEGGGALFQVQVMSTDESAGIPVLLIGLLGRIAISRLSSIIRRRKRTCSQTSPERRLLVLKPEDPTAKDEETNMNKL